MIHTWKITKTKTDEIRFDDSTSLDSITRQLPDGFYSTFRTYAGCTRVVGLSAHIRRLPDVNASFLRRHLNQLLAPYRPGEARIRVMITKRGQLHVSIEPLRLLPSETYEKGVRVETTDIHRINPRIKSTAFIGASKDERRHLAQAGIHEALLVKNGKILEGMTSNFFYVIGADKQRFVGTAQRDILLGVTRTMVIRAARGKGIEVRYSPLKLSQVTAISEAFITSSSRGIVPVIQIDDVTVGQGRPGETTRLLISGYDEYVLSHTEKI